MNRAAPTAGQVMRSLRELSTLRRKHFILEDQPDLSCPVAIGVGGNCRCGADRVNAVIDDVTDTLEAALEGFLGVTKEATGTGGISRNGGRRARAGRGPNLRVIGPSELQL